LAWFLQIDLILKILQNTRHAVLSFIKAMTLVFHQAPEGRGGFLIIDKLQLASTVFRTDLQINAASHCLAICF
jgi:hypothetical protein